MCDVTAAVVAGTAVAGAAASTMNKPKAQTTTSDNSPWAAQQPYLQTGMAAAQEQFDAGKAQGPYTGAYSAGLTDAQKLGYQNATDYAQGPGASLASQAAGSSAALMGSTSPFLQNAGALAANGSGPMNSTAAGVLTGAANGQVLGQTTAAGTTGLAGQQGALSTAQGLSAKAAGDPNAGILAGARGYVDNDLVQAQVDAATRDVTTKFSNETIPGLNARAMAGGNVNSARAGAAEAVARTAAQNQAADISTAIRSNAYNTGLATSLAATQQQNDLALGANAQTASTAGALSSLGEGQRQFNGGNQLSAATSLGQQSLQQQQIDANTRLQANGQLGQAALSGIDAANAAGALSDANTTRLVGAGEAYQGEQSRQLQEAQAQFYARQQYDQQNLGAYWNIVGNPMGSTTSTTTPAAQGQSMVQGALGGAAAGAGLYSSIYPSTGGAGGTIGQATSAYKPVVNPK